MAQVAPVPGKKAAGPAEVRKQTGPSATGLLMQAVAAASKERSGISLAALKKSLAASGYDVEKNNSRLKLVLRGLVAKGMLLQIKGTGASGSFKLNKKRADRNQQSAGAKKSTGAAKKAKRAAGAARAKKAVKKPASVAAKKPKSPAKLKAKAKVKPKASTKAKPAPKKK